jgi:hypothetical protein
MAVKASGVELHIEELVLHGFPPSSRHRIGDALVRELTRLLAEDGVPPALAEGGEGPGLDVESLQIAHDARPDAVGAQLARAVYGGFKR